eukprot:TRINITY_DN4465_c0_g1_i4.p1 TRINITY_DN4465_c0_g1~~TRINITY_DN4465_c0_g1_i4.p1  ORF type:complete len:1033 (-),score=367.66 TRINITY_DN4465_c0_g1_i4:157-3255(-)
MNDSKAWEVDTLRGHFNNVSCVIFHPRQDLILSNSEDKSIRVWDMSKRKGVQTFRREHDRFWIMCSHPSMNLFAAGHDSGMIVFKLERERPAYTTHQNTLFYVKDRYLRAYDFAHAKDVSLMAIRRPSSASPPRSIAYNSIEHAVIVCNDDDDGVYELYHIPRDAGSQSSSSNSAPDSKRGVGRCAVFVARNRFAVLDKKGEVVVKNFKNEVTKRCQPPHSGTDMMFYAGTGAVLLRCEDRITLFDVQHSKTVAEISCPMVKYVVWSNDMQHLALFSKHVIVIANKNLEQLATIHETVRVKSGAWDEHGVFVYSTLNHIKYVLPSGDAGVIRTLENPIYITKVKGSTVYALDRKFKNRVIGIDNTEYRFKLALSQKKYGDVMRMIKHSRLQGQSIIAYLQKKGYAEVALHFVKDEKTRFNLALECGNIDIAQECARSLQDEDCWRRLGNAALQQGDHQTVEMAYQRTKDYERLSFLYLITGNIAKLRRMVDIAERRKDVMARFHTALYLGDVVEQVRVLNDVGQLPLAYITAAMHNLAEDAEVLAQNIREEAAVRGQMANQSEDDEQLVQDPLQNFDTEAAMGRAQLLKPPIPILFGENWPLLKVSRGYFDGSSVDEIMKMGLDDTDIGDTDIGPTGDWDTGDLDIDFGGGESSTTNAGDFLGGAGDDIFGGGDDMGGSGWDTGDLDLDLDLEGMGVPADLNPFSAGGAGDGSNYYVPPTAGQSVERLWSDNSNLAADQVASGNYEVAMQLLNQQLGIINFAPLKSNFIALYTGAHTTMNGLPLLPSMVTGLQRQPGLPSITFNIVQSVDRLKMAYKATSAGKFGEAVSHFTNILHTIPLLVVNSKVEVTEVLELIRICREYITGLRLETARKEAGKDVVKMGSLAAYFTNCQLENMHLMLSLRSAMTLHFKMKNLGYAAGFARRLLDLNPSEDVATQCRKVQAIADSQNRANAIEIDYDERNPFVVCCETFTPIYKGSPVIQCPFCSSAYIPDCSGHLCSTCNLSKIGAQVGGLSIISGGRGGSSSSSGRF